ncbi:MAG: hypothetical protein ACYC45_08690 [Acidithiobacillus ferriphilus]|nr:hypothetical protein [Acidithiobacillus ferriphilus]MBU2784641.1 hypothetical protein [Acidithiobacillus ferriphilus]MBU2828594.1 hypothetical protein [Acidithiobacillus ferriphilus]MBU2846768.1 hypothetical protein [Acidithiobacillus ferriphilus]UEP58757.1 hypothetical protein K1Y48_10660 [Acidithiobacillus ferriphilus]
MSKESCLAANNDRDDESWNGNIVLIIALLWAIIALGGYYITLRVMF